MGSLIDELQRREAAARAEVEELITHKPVAAADAEMASAPPYRVRAVGRPSPAGRAVRGQAAGAG
jgi:hypothetical protein